MNDAPIPAATLIVLRAGAKGVEVLMVERATDLAFAGGALVFPGGRIDPGDRRIAAAFGGDADDLAARVAAIRETIEEAGIAVGVDRPMLRHRDALLAGEPVETLLPAASIDIDALVPFARWLPLGLGHRVFDTRFYLARGGMDEPVPDGGENVGAFWAPPADVIAGGGRLLFPTRRNLERLAGYPGLDAAFADARSRSVRTITPWIESREGLDHLCIPDDLGYPVTAEPMTVAMRG